MPEKYFGECCPCPLSATPMLSALLCTSHFSRLSLSYDFERKIGFIPATAVKVVRKFKCERECYTNEHTYWIHRYQLLLFVYETTTAISTRKLCYRKDDRAMRHIHGCPENFRDSLTTPTATIPNSFHGLLFGSTL